MLSPPHAIKMFLHIKLQPSQLAAVQLYKLGSCQLNKLSNQPNQHKVQFAQNMKISQLYKLLLPLISKYMTSPAPIITYTSKVLALNHTYKHLNISQRNQLHGRFQT